MSTTSVMFAARGPAEAEPLMLPTPNCPSRLVPQVITDPSSRSATEWTVPPAVFTTAPGWPVCEPAVTLTLSCALLPGASVDWARTTVDPTDSAVTTPASTVATAGVSLLQVTAVVEAPPSVAVTVALSPTFRVNDPGCSSSRGPLGCVGPPQPARVRTRAKAR